MAPLLRIPGLALALSASATSEVCPDGTCISEEEVSLLQGVALKSQPQSKSRMESLLESAKNMLKNGVGTGETTDVSIYVNASSEEVTGPVFGAMRDEHNQNQDMLDQFHAALESALAALAEGNERVVSLNSQEKEASAAHKICRGQGVGSDDTQSEHYRCTVKKECDTHMFGLWGRWIDEESQLHVIHNRIDDHFCVQTENNGSQVVFRNFAVEKMGTWMDQKTTVDGAMEAYVAEVDVCAETITALDIRTAECDALQTELEHKACLHTQEIRDTLDAFHGEWDPSILHEAINHTRAQEAARKEEFRTLQTVLCLLDRIRDRNGVPCDTATDEAAMLTNTCFMTGVNANTTEFDIIYPPELTPPGPCPSRDAVSHDCLPVETPEPCSADFISQEYANLPAVPTPTFSHDNPACNARQECQACAAHLNPHPVLPPTMEVGKVRMPNTLECAETNSCENQGIVRHNFAQEFAEPPVVVPMMSTVGNNPARARVFDVTATGFSVIIAEPKGQDGPHLGNDVGFIAMLPGVHTVNGVRVEAGRESTRNFVEWDDRVIHGGEANVITFQTQFAERPAFLAALQTRTNNGEGYNLAYWEPFMGVATTILSNHETDVILELHEVGGAVTVEEEIGWLAMEAGHGCFGDLCYAASVVELNRNNESGWTAFWADYSFPIPEHSYTPDNFDLGSSDPIVVSTTNTRNDDNGGWPRLHAATASSFQIIVDECRAEDNERNHRAEDISVIAFSGAATLPVPVEANLD